MSRLLTEMMHSYFEEAGADQVPSGTPWSRPFEVPSIKISGTPVKPRTKSEWEVGRSPRCLKKRFEFPEHHRMVAFVQELMSHEAETGHYGRVVCEFPHVEIQVRTHDLDDVTELDQDYAKTCDQIYEDVKQYTVGGFGDQDW